MSDQLGNAIIWTIGGVGAAYVLAWLVSVACFGWVGAAGMAALTIAGFVAPFVDWWRVRRALSKLPTLPRAIARWRSR